MPLIVFGTILFATPWAFPAFLFGSLGFIAVYEYIVRRVVKPPRRAWALWALLVVIWTVGAWLVADEIRNIVEQRHSAVFWIFFAVPLVVLVGVAAWRIRAVRRTGPPNRAQSRRALIMVILLLMTFWFFHWMLLSR